MCGGSEKTSFTKCFHLYQNEPDQCDKTDHTRTQGCAVKRTPMHFYMYTVQCNQVTQKKKNTVPFITFLSINDTLKTQ